MNAVIYVRVSSAEQVEGTSLDTQEAACRDYARRHNLVVSKVFVEQGESAKYADRTQLLALLDYCKTKSHGVSVLLVWKIDRLARNVEDHFAIKAALRRHGVSVSSVTEPIAADANGRLLETILAGFAAFDNDVRAVRTVQGLKARLREGISPWKPPIGYLAPKNGKKTQPDRPDPVRFEPLQKAWALVTTGLYKQSEIVRQLRQWGVVGYHGKPFSSQALHKMLVNPFYVGILRDPWSGEEHRGRHVPMVSARDFAAVQRTLHRRGPHMSAKAAHPAFPLRGFVKCPTCSQRMTAAWAQGRRRRYPYYNCYSRSCSTRTRSYSAERVHDEFLRFLSTLSVPVSRTSSVLRALRCAFDDGRDIAQKVVAATAAEIATLTRERSELVSMRARGLITDAEFALQRDILSQRQAAFEEQDHHQLDDWRLSRLDEQELMAGLRTLPTLWAEVPDELKLVFEELVLPEGYNFGAVRTARVGLLFGALEHAGSPDSHLVDLTPTNLNQLMEQIEKLLEITQAVRRRTEQLKEAG